MEKIISVVDIDKKSVIEISNTDTIFFMKTLWIASTFDTLKDTTCKNSDLFFIKNIHENVLFFVSCVGKFFMNTFCQRN